MLGMDLEPSNLGEITWAAQPHQGLADECLELVSGRAADGIPEATGTWLAQSSRPCRSQAATRARSSTTSGLTLREEMPSWGARQRQFSADVRAGRASRQARQFAAI